MNFKREKTIEDYQIKKESPELLRNYVKILDDLNVANRKIKTFEERKVKFLLLINY